MLTGGEWGGWELEIVTKPHSYCAKEKCKTVHALEHLTIKMYEEVEAKRYAFVTSEIDGGNKFALS
jgi:hypothetical protein